MELNQTAILNQLSYSRFFNNDSISISSLRKSSQIKAKEVSKGNHFLCLQGISEINYDKYNSFFYPYDEDLGPVGKNMDIGFSLRPMLVEELYEYLSDQPVTETYKIHVHGDKRKNRESLEAIIEVKYCKVKVSMPKKHIDKSLPEYIELTTIEAREISSTIPAGEKPILWRLLTTHQVNDSATTILMVTWHNTRWLIEELFRLLKLQGIVIELSQLESWKGLKKLAVMAKEVALKIVQLRQNRDGLCSISGSVVFSEEEMEFAETESQSRYEGKTQLQKNSHPKGSLARISWIMIRIEDRKGYQNTSKPSPITMKKGLDKFNTIYQGLLLSKLYKDVYKE